MGMKSMSTARIRATSIARFAAFAVALSALTTCDLFKSGLGSKIDVSAPTVDVSSLQNGDYINAARTLSGTVGDDVQVKAISVAVNSGSTLVATLNASLSGSNWSVVLDPASLFPASAYPNGVETQADLVISVSDNSGKTSERRLVLYFDTIKPVVSNLNPSMENLAKADTYLSEVASFEGSVKDGFGVESISFRAGGAELWDATRGTSPWTVYSDTTTFAAGTGGVTDAGGGVLRVPVEIVATDRAGNLSTPVTGFFLVDQNRSAPWITGPNANFFLNPVSDVSTTILAPRDRLILKISDSDGIDAASIRASIADPASPSAPFATYTIANSGIALTKLQEDGERLLKAELAIELPATADLPDGMGEYAFSIHASDDATKKASLPSKPAQSVSRDYSDISLTISDAVPAVTVSSPANGAIVQDLAAAGTVTDGIGVESVMVGLDGADPVGAVLAGLPHAKSCAWSYSPSAPLAEGTHIIDIRGSNIGDKWSAVTQRQFTVDRTAPTLEILSVAPATSNASLRPSVFADVTSAGDPGGVYNKVNGIARIRVSATDQNPLASVTWRLVRLSDSAVIAPDTAVSSAWTVDLNTTSSGASPLNLVDGAKYVFTVVATDKAGNSSTLQRTLLISQVGDEPTVTLKNMTSLATTSATASSNLMLSNPRVDATIMDDDWVDASSIGILIDQNPSDPSPTWIALAGTRSSDGTVSVSRAFSALSDGRHWIYLRASDTDVNGTDGRKAGLAATSSQVGPIWFAIDLTPPAIAFNGATEGLYVSSTKSLSGTVSSALALDASTPLTFSFNGGTFPGALDPAATNSGSHAWTYSLDAGGAAEGEQPLVATALDVFGVTSTRTLSVTVDRTVPEVSVNDGNPLPYFSDVNGLSLVGTIRDVRSGVASMTATVRLVATDVDVTSNTKLIWNAAAGTPNTTGNWSLDLSALTTGTYSVSLHVVDKAGNANNDVAALTVIVDKDMPTVSLGSPVAGTVYNAASVKPDKWAGTSTETFFSSGTVILDGTAIGTLSGSGAWEITSDWDSLLQGTHTLVVKVTDLGGHTGSASATFTKDTIAPTLSVTTPEAGSWMSAASLTIRGGVDDGAGMGVDVVYYIAAASTISHSSDTSAVIASSWTKANGTGSWNGTLSLSSLGEGSMILWTTALDKAGNWTPISSTAFSVDFSNPRAIFTMPESAAVYQRNTAISLAGIADDDAYNYDGETRKEGPAFRAATSATLSYSKDGGTAVNVTTGSSTNPLQWNSTNGEWSWTLPEYETVGAGSIIAGQAYVIATIGTTNFTAVGASGNDVGTRFTASGAGTGTGTVYVLAKAGTFAVGQEYVIETVGSTDFTTIGAAFNTLGTHFIATAAGGGSGTAYRAGAMDGLYVLTLVVKDMAGNTSTATRTVQVDTTAPAVAINSPAAEEIFATNACIIGGTSKDTGGVGFAGAETDARYSLDGSNWTNLGSLASTINWSASGISLGAEGAKALYVRSTDKVGNVGTAKARFYYDKEAPSLSESSIGTADTQYRNADAAFGGTVFDTNAMKSLAVAIGAAEATPVTIAATTVPVTVTTGNSVTSALNAPGHGFKNGDPVRIIGTVLPTDGVSVSLSSDRAYYVLNATAGSFQIALNSGDVTAMALNSAGTDVSVTAQKWSYSLSSSVEGIYSLTFTATDAANRKTSLARTVMIDKTKPTMALSTIDGGAEATFGNWKMKAALAVTGIAADAAAPTNSGLAQLQYSLNSTNGSNGDWSDFTAAASWSNTITFAEGGNTLYVRALDKAGNVSNASTTAGQMTTTMVRVDTIAPTCETTAPASINYVNGKSSLGITVTGVDATSHMNQASASLSSTSWSEIAAAVSISEGPATYAIPAATLAGLSDGAHKVYFRTTDIAGNVSSVSSLNLFVDKTAPSLTFSSHANNATVNKLVSVNGTANELNGLASVKVVVLNPSTAVSAGSFVPGITYRIQSLGDTDFTKLGASSNTVGLSFVALGAGDGTVTTPGTAYAWEDAGKSVAAIEASSIVAGNAYRIITTHADTDYTKIGAPANTVGVEFIATAAGTNTGTGSGTVRSLADGSNNWSFPSFNTADTVNWPSATYDADSLATGYQMRIAAIATDIAGNTGSVERLLTIDQNGDKPIISLNNLVTNGTSTLIGSTTIYGTVDDDDGVSELKISNEAVSDWSTVAAISLSGQSFAYTVTGNNGAKKLWFWVKDTAGQEFATADAKSDTTPRLLRVYKANELVTGSTYVINFVGTTEFNKLGATSNATKVEFTKNSNTTDMTGTGTAYLKSAPYLETPLSFRLDTVEPTVYDTLALRLANVPVTGYSSSSDTIVSTVANSLSAGDQVVFGAQSGGSVPGGLTAGTVYYVMSDSLTPTSFKVASTSGGTTAVEIASAGVNAYFYSTFRSYDATNAFYGGAASGKFSVRVQAGDDNALDTCVVSVTDSKSVSVSAGASREATRINASSVAIGTDMITLVSNHGLSDGDMVFFAGDSLPSGLSADLLYYAIYTESASLKVSTQKNNASTIVDLTATGGSFYLYTNWTTSSNLDISGLTSGAATLSVIVKDGSGLEKTVSKTITIDNVQPSLNFGSSPASGDLVNGDVTFKGVALDNQSSVTLVQYKIGADDWKSAVGTASWSIPFTTANGNAIDTFATTAYSTYQSAAGTWKFPILVRAIDKAGNVYADSSFYLNIDPSGDKPKSTISYPLAKDNPLGGTVRIYGAATDDDAVGSMYMQIDCVTNQAQITGIDTVNHTFTSVSHGLVAGDEVMLRGTTIPTGLDKGTSYYVIGSSLQPDTFQLAAASGSSTPVTFSGPISNCYFYTPTDLPISSVSGNVIHTASNNGLSAGDQVIFGGDSLPGGISSDATYYVMSTSLTATSFMVTTDSGNLTTGEASVTSAGTNAYIYSFNAKDTVTADFDFNAVTPDTTVDWYNGGLGRTISGAYNWNQSINSVGEFNSGNTTNTRPIHVRVRAQDYKSNGAAAVYGPWVETVIDFDNNVPKFGSAQALVLSADQVYNSGIDTPYAAGDYVTGTLYLMGSVEDESYVSNILISGSVCGIPLSGSLAGNPLWFPNKVASPTYTGYYNRYDFCIPITTSGTGDVSFTITATDEANHSSKVNVLLQADNNAPSGTYSGDTPMVQSDGVYKVAGTADDSTGSGVKKIELYFVRFQTGSTEIGRFYKPTPDTSSSTVTRSNFSTVPTKVFSNGTFLYPSDSNYVLTVDYNGTETSESQDTDGYLEKLKAASGTSYSWYMDINSLSIPDGPIQIHYVVYDQANNASHYVISTFVQNNGPALGSITLGTDLDDSGAVSAIGGGETIDYTTSASSTTTSPTFRVKAAPMSFDLGITKGNNDIYYKIAYGSGPTTLRSLVTSGGNYVDGATYKIVSHGTGGASAFTAIGADTGAVGEYFVAEGPGTTGVTGTAYPVARQASGGAAIRINLAASELAAIGDGLKTFTVTLYDGTEETTPGVDSLSIAKSITATLQLGDSTAPVAAVSPFYWNSASSNSLYGNSPVKGHIDYASGSTNGTDPDVSGMVSVRGTAYDDQRIQRLYARVDGNTFKGALTVAATNPVISTGTAAHGMVAGDIVYFGTTTGNLIAGKPYFVISTGLNTYTFEVTATFGGTTAVTPDTSSTTVLGTTYRSVATYASAAWTKIADTMASSTGWAFTVETASIGQGGHSIEWQMDWDSSKVSGGAALDTVISVAALDKGGNVSLSTTVSSGSVSGTGIVSGRTYQITALGSGNESAFVGIGASTGAVGEYFTATSGGTSGCGSVSALANTPAYQVDVVPYIVTLTDVSATTNKSPFDGTRLSDTSMNPGKAGYYALYQGAVGVTLTGFNLPLTADSGAKGVAIGATSLTPSYSSRTSMSLTLPSNITTSSGNDSLVVTTNGVASINNTDSANAYNQLSGTFTASDSTYLTYADGTATGANGAYDDRYVYIDEQSPAIAVAPFGNTFDSSYDYDDSAKTNGGSFTNGKKPLVNVMRYTDNIAQTSTSSNDKATKWFGHVEYAQHSKYNNNTVTLDGGNTTFTSGAAHGLSVGDVVWFSWATAPANAAKTGPYYVLTVPGTTTFTVSDTITGTSAFAFGSGGTAMFLGTPDISGCVIFRGKASDNQRIKKITAKIIGFDAGVNDTLGNPHSSGEEFDIYTGGASGSAGTFNSSAANGWSAALDGSDNVLSSSRTAKGHVLNWTFTFDSQKIDTSTSGRVAVTFTVYDQSVIGTTTRSSSSTMYVDVVPYIVSMSRAASFTTNRSHEGAYVFRRGETAYVDGFNLYKTSTTYLPTLSIGGATATVSSYGNVSTTNLQAMQRLTTTIPETTGAYASSGEVSLTTNSVAAQDNTNDNNVLGNYLNPDYATYYNREATSLYASDGSGFWTDDRKVYIWISNNNSTANQANGYFYGSDSPIYPAMTYDGGNLYASWSNYSASGVFTSTATTRTSTKILNGCDPFEYTDISYGNGRPIIATLGNQSSLGSFAQTSCGGVVLYADNASSNNTMGSTISTSTFCRLESLYYNAKLMQFTNERVVTNGTSGHYVTYYDTYSKALKFHWIANGTGPGTGQQADWVNIDGGADSNDTYIACAGSTSYNQALVPTNRVLANATTTLTVTNLLVADGSTVVANANLMTLTDGTNNYTMTSPYAGVVKFLVDVGSSLAATYNSNATTYAYPSVALIYPTGTTNIKRSHAAGEYSSIVLAPNASNVLTYPVIVYYSASEQTLKIAHASYSSATPGTTNNYLKWKLQYVMDSSTDANYQYSGKYVSAKIDGDGYLHIAFYRVSTGDLLYIKSTNNPNDGVTDYTFGKSVVIDSIGSVGSGTDISMTGAAPYYPYISYYDQSNFDSFNGLKTGLVHVTSSGSFIVGQTYTIASLGTGTDWTAIGAGSSPAVGTSFVATGSGSGTGKATSWDYMTAPLVYSVPSDARTQIEYNTYVSPAAGVVSTDNTSWSAAIGYKSDDYYRLAYLTPGY